ncbi:unnamed protein product [Rotaria sp. Silwood1]|nr:unnamed protein product [Rotaria sp. Silwood1]CAF4863418.1 unnamed protein product [Rotaria sp. Silwood1]
MPLLKWLKENIKKISPKNTTQDLDLDDDDRRQAEEETTTNHDGEEVTHDDEIKLVYFASATPKQHLIDILSVSYKDTQPFIDEIKCVEYVKSTISKVFLIIDGTPSTTLIEAIEPLNQIDSVFVYSPSSNDVTRVNEKQHSYILNWCENEAALHESINKSREEFHKQADAFRMFNKEEKAAYDLSKEQGSFVFFQIFKLLLKNMPNTYEAKKTMIIDFSEQLELKFKELKEEQKDILKLYRAAKLSSDELANFQNSIGNLISCSGYLSTSGEYSVAYGFATKSPKREGFEGAVFEYIVDLDVVQNIVLAVIHEYSAFPEEAEVIVDIGQRKNKISIFIYRSIEID